ncbi:hypothetical protein AB0G15_36265 [Streptosporangium sp. NPDC023825]|uniref:hypothetical protein n=1 Tax=Streptosporangium sp. NPDC023825 TaxID=3154909 RepID=UPI003426139C
MSHRDEEALIRTLAGAARSAPEPVEDLVVAIGRQRRRRRRVRAQSVLAVAGMIAVVGGMAVVRDTLPNRGGEGVSMTQAAPPVDASENTEQPVQSGAGGPANRGATAPIDVRPVAEVWPMAVSTIPVRAADGYRYRPVTGLSATKLLLSAESSFERSGRLEVYDTADRSSTVLTTMPDTGVKGYFAGRFEVGSDYIAWWGGTPNDPDEWADFWVVPRSGGVARRVGEVTGDLSKVTRIAVTSDFFLWSVSGGGIYRMPLGGGSPERLGNTDGLHLLAWPLAADVGEREGEGGAGNQTRTVDLETGRTTEVSVPEGGRGFRCGPVWCFGQQGDAMVVQRPDGSDRRLLPGFSAGRGVVDRFGVMGPPFSEKRDAYVPLLTVYDAVTGLAAGISQMWEGGGGYGMGISSSPSSILYWDADKRTVEDCGTADGRGRPRPSGAPAPTGEGTVCTTREVGGGKEFTVVNLLAVPSTK